MKLIIDAPDEIVKKGFEGPLTDEERQILIRAIGNGTTYKVEGDLISRSALKEVITANHYLLSARNNSIDYGMFTTGIMQAIDHAPAVTPKQGEWIMQRHDLDGCFYTCSNCGRMIRVPLFIDDPEDNETLEDYPYCHCGAKMSYKR